MHHSEDNALIDLLPVKIKDLNSKMKVYDQTYYFTVACNLRRTKSVKAREMFVAPKKNAKAAVGFNIDIDTDVNFNTYIKKEDEDN